MKKIENVLSFLGERNYSSHEKRIEYNLINAYKNQLEWNLLSPIEKQNLRKINLKSVKRYHEEDRNSEFSVENAIIELYDLGFSVKSNLNIHHKNKGISYTRFELLIDIIMSTIDMSPLLKNRKFPPSIIFKSLKDDFEDEKITELDRVIALLEKLEKNG